jgi:putative endonuclease
MKYYYVYFTTNPTRTVLYIGVTNNLARRMSEHRANRNQKLKFAGNTFATILFIMKNFTISEMLFQGKRTKKVAT